MQRNVQGSNGSRHGNTHDCTRDTGKKFRGLQPRRYDRPITRTNAVWNALFQSLGGCIDTDACDQIWNDDSSLKKKWGNRTYMKMKALDEIYLIDILRLWISS